MINHPKSPLTPYQEKCFNILIEFDRVCVKNNIKYYLLYGTVLGAVRHKGFIPWDDDVDVGVPRSDYERLLSLCKEFRPPYVLEYFQIAGSYIHPFAKIYNSMTTVIESSENPFKRGVWIDVFPLDGTFRSKPLQYLHIQLIQIINRIFSLKLKRYPKRYKLSLRFIAKNISTFLLKAINMSIVYWMLDRLGKLVDYDKAYYIGSFYSSYGMREIIPAECIRDSIIKLEFCGVLFPAPAKPHEYLTLLYHEYMTLPALSERVGHSMQYINLDVPYDSN